MNLDDTPFAPLAIHLVDLLHALDGTDITITLVGGFGLALRRLYAEERGFQTFIERVPVARATEDFDLLIDLEALKDHEKMSRLRVILDQLGYVEIDRARYYQFAKPGTSTGGRNVKVDLLAPEPDQEHLDNYRTGSGVNAYRITAKTPAQARKVRLHAHITPEAIASDEQPTLIPLEATGSDGQRRQVTVRLPHTYTLYAMKLHAFRDEHEGKKSGDRRAYAEKHAGDLYTLTALLTADEFDQLTSFRERHARTSAAQDAAQIVATYFPHERAPGALTVLNRYDVRVEDLRAFLDVLRDQFPVVAD
ncbi:hypothetical protein [Deinococcus soli (ex Cha et al. 2016)]|uniref:hypothetical protein n=1 Tax=Deinococcus soli (ex Cha et al. 2016) TaxID=1309411 RepID=UPI001662C193|nr:hypothetical protein [Deinococcus soli (ex Cha et al. 2016)]GGB84283.1 hypothetical protein GCM10008019_45380 [Deinococcus soli (ex Cha et al. 2016)]